MFLYNFDDQINLVFYLYCHYFIFITNQSLFIIKKSLWTNVERGIPEKIVNMTKE